MAVLDRAARQRKVRRIQTGVAVVAVAGLGIFGELAAHTGHTAAQQITTPDQRISSLEQAGNGSFFSVGGAAPPPLSAGGSPPQTSSGGS